MIQETSLEIKVTISASQDEYSQAVKFISDYPMRAYIDQIGNGSYELTFYYYSDWTDFRRKFNIKWRPLKNDTARECLEEVERIEKEG